MRDAIDPGIQNVLLHMSRSINDFLPVATATPSIRDPLRDPVSVFPSLCFGAETSSGAPIAGEHLILRRTSYLFQHKGLPEAVVVVTAPQQAAFPLYSPTPGRVCHQQCLQAWQPVGRLAATRHATTKSGCRRHHDPKPLCLGIQHSDTGAHCLLALTLGLQINLLVCLL